MQSGQKKIYLKYLEKTVNFNQNNKLKTRLKDLNNKLLNICFSLSFNQKLSKKDHEILKNMEQDLNNNIV